MHDMLFIVLLNITKMKKLVKVLEYELVRTILGKDFISPVDIMNYRKWITYTVEQLSMFSKTIPPLEILEWCRDHNFMLVAGPNRTMSLAEISLMEDLYSKQGRRYCGFKFTNEDKVKTKWYMVCKDPILTCLSFGKQVVRLSENQTTLNATEFVWAIMTYKAVRGIYLFSENSVRTSSLDPDSHSVEVGPYLGDGLVFNGRWDGYSSYYLGLAVALK